MYVQAYVQEVQGLWLLQGEGFALHKPQGKSLYVGTLSLGFALASPRLPVPFCKERLSVHGSPPAQPFFFPKTLISTRCHESGQLSQRAEYGSIQNWR